MLLLDTSFILVCAEWKIDLFSELSRVTGLVPNYISGTEEELTGLAKGNSRRAAIAKLSLGFLKRMKKIISVGTVDDFLLKTAKKGDFVATMDVELRRLLRQRGISVLIVRQKKYIVEYEGK